MTKYMTLVAITLASVLSACTNTSQPLPPSALGDSPTLSGTISNLAEAKLNGTALVVKAKIRTASGAEKVIAEGTVTASGAFSMKLPGSNTLAADLQDFTVTLPEQQTCTGVIADPKSYKGVYLSLFLYSNNQPVGGSLLYTNGDVGVTYVFVDRNVVTKFSCSSDGAKTDFDFDLKKGWNSTLTVIFPGPNPSRTSSGVPDSSYQWLVLLEQNPVPIPSSRFTDLATSSQ
jgi:hypothetical protein